MPPLLPGGPGGPGGPGEPMHCMGGHGGDRGGFPQEESRVPEGTHLEEEMSSTERKTGSAPIWGVETRTLPGEQNATSVSP